MQPTAVTCVRIVEDSGVLAEMLGVMMDFEGIRYCQTTDNFQALLGPMYWENVTAVLCDLDLGGPTTGEMILSYLKEAHPWVKRVVLSAIPDASSKRIQMLAHLVLIKPAEYSQIMEAVR